MNARGDLIQMCESTRAIWVKNLRQHTSEPQSFVRSRSIKTYPVTPRLPVGD
jgi:hypothetical protein